MIPKIAIGGLWHETNTFASGVTVRTDFERYQFVRAQQLIDRYRNTNTELGGVIDASADNGFCVVPILFAAAVPSGIIEHATAMQLCDELVAGIENAGRIDGVILALHGAAVAEEIEDLDALILQRVRQVVGVDIPVVATFDFHANLSDSMVREATVLIGYDTYPHTDMAARGQEAAAVMMDIISSKSPPQAALRKIPLLTLPLDQQTDQEPMRGIMTALAEVEEKPGIVCGSIAMGFAYADVSYLGASVLVYASTADAAEVAASKLAHGIWAQRERFESKTVPVDEGVARALECDRRPVVIVEAADNIGGGSSADATGVLKALLDAGPSRAVIVIKDPQAVQEAVRIGICNRYTARIGGKTDDRHGPTIEVEVVVRRISDGRYTHKGSYMTGYVTEMGTTAVVESGGIQIVLTSLRAMPFDAEQLRCVGIEPAAQDIIVVKSAIAWKAAFGEIAREVIVVDTPGACPMHTDRLHYHSMLQPLYPLNPDTDYDP